MNSGWPDAATRDLQRRLVDWIHNAPAGFVQFGPTRASCWGLTAAAAADLERGFEALALELFAYQFERVPLYRRWCEALDRPPAQVQKAHQIPALPVQAFRDERVCGFPPTSNSVRFHTSGTSSERTGTIHLDDLTLYDTALLRGFAHHVLPDRDEMRMLSLVPTRAESPHSSLSYMIDRVQRQWGGSRSGCFVADETLQVDRLQRALQDCVRDREPVLLLGTAFAWVAFLDACRDRRWSVVLPSGSRLFETGGYKGRTRQLSRVALHRAIEEHLGIDPTHVVSEYGMTELASQYYTLNLRLAVVDGRHENAAVWSTPAWLRPRLLEAQQSLPADLPGASAAGLLSHHDLANRASVAHLLTADLGIPAGCSFLLEGRVPSADLRGCGLVQEDWSQAGASS
jgi:hypothetical protein